MTLLVGWFGGDPALKYLGGMDQATINQLLNLLVVIVSGFFVWAKASQIQTKAKLEEKVVDVKSSEQDMAQQLADTRRELRNQQNLLADKEQEVEGLKRIPPEPSQQRSMTTKRPSRAKK